MLDKLALIEERYASLGRELEETLQDYQRANELAKERSELEDVVTLAQKYRQSLEQIEQARDLQNSEDSDMRALAQAELEELLPRSESLEKEIKALLVPKDRRDARNVIIEIRAGTGGDEAGLFAADLFRMYSR